MPMHAVPECSSQCPGAFSAHPGAAMMAPVLLHASCCQQAEQALCTFEPQVWTVSRFVRYRSARGPCPC